MVCVHWHAYIAAVLMAPGHGPLSNHELIPLQGSGRVGVFGPTESIIVKGARSINMLKQYCRLITYPTAGDYTTSCSTRVG